MSKELINNIQSFISTSEHITRMLETSKLLRKDIANQVDSMGLGPVNEDAPVEFILGDMVVSVKKAKLCNDYTVTYKSLKVIHD